MAGIFLIADVHNRTPLRARPAVNTVYRNRGSGIALAFRCGGFTFCACVPSGFAFSSGTRGGFVFRRLTFAFFQLTFRFA